MAKANAASGASVYVAEDAEVPDLGPDVRLVGPGAPADEEPETGDAPEVEEERAEEDLETADTAAEAQHDVGSAEPTLAGSEFGVTFPAAPARPAGNASTEAWRDYVGALPGIDAPAYAGWSELSRAELQEIADELDPR